MTAPAATAVREAPAVYNEQAERAAQRHLVNTHVCAQCHGPLTLRWKSAWGVECPKQCEPGGFVTEAHAHAWQKQNANDAAIVAANYPELAPKRKIDRRAARAALFGED